jgi:hypothetical protein
MNREIRAKVFELFLRNKQRARSLSTALRERLSKTSSYKRVKSNSEPWTQEPPRSIAEAVDVSDRVEDAMRDWKIVSP